MIFFNVLAALSLLLACLCCFVNPKHIWWIGFFGLVYMYLLALNLCFVAYWIFSSKKKYVVISIVTIIIGWTFIGKNIQFFSKKMPDEKMEKSFKIISFNVQGFEQMDKKQPNGEMLNMFDFFRKEAPDIICMQEFVINNRKEINENSILKKLEKMPYSHVNLTGTYYGIATFSKYPIIRRELVFADKTTNACMFSDIVIREDTVRVFNIHLKSVGFNKDERHLLNNVVKKEYDKSDISTILSIMRNLKNSSLEREKQVEILTEHINKSPHPVIICGDYNDPPASYSYRKVRGNRKDAFIEAGSGRSPTYILGPLASVRIDYIMYSDIFEAYDYDSPRVHISDHFPVICRLVKK